MRALALLVALAGCGSKDAADDYVRKSKNTEARLNLMRLSKTARVLHLEKGALPVGKVGPTPSASCCASPEKKCKVDAQTWADPTWQALDFIIEEDTRFQYSYESDGQTFTATATGDVSCDGKPQTYRITGKVENQALVVDTSQIDSTRR